MDNFLIKLQTYIIKKYAIVHFFIKWIFLLALLSLIIFKPQKTGKYIGKWSKNIVSSFVIEYNDTININK